MPQGWQIFFLSSKLTRRYKPKENQTSVVPLFVEIYIFIKTKIEENTLVLLDPGATNLRYASAAQK